MQRNNHKNQNKKSRRGVCCRTVRLPACLCCQTGSRCPRRPDQSNQTNAENIEASLRLPVRGRRCNALAVSSVGCWRRYGDQMVDEGRIEREKRWGGEVEVQGTSCRLQVKLDGQEKSNDRWAIARLLSGRFNVDKFLMSPSGPNQNLAAQLVRNRHGESGGQPFCPRRKCRHTVVIHAPQSTFDAGPRSAQ